MMGIMKRVAVVLLLGAYAVSVRGEVFQMDVRGDAKVEVNEVGGEYKVVCAFSPQTKFDSAINAKFNDSKADSLCKRGIAIYLKVGTNDLLTVAGQYSVAPVENVNGKLRYFFGVPVAGCKVEVGAKKPKEMPVPNTAGVPVATNSVLQTDKSIVKPTIVTSFEN